MSNQQRSEYLSEEIRDYVHKINDGVSTAIIAKKFGIHQDIARKHLENLTKLRELFATNVNRNTKVYFPNGTLIHQYLRRKIEFPDRSFKFSINQIGNREVLHVQEIKYSLLTGEKPEGGILIDVTNIDKFIYEIESLLKKLEELKHGK
jgi:hypothetical protein